MEHGRFAQRRVFKSAALLIFTRRPFPLAIPNETNEKWVTFFTFRPVVFEFFNCGKNRQAEELGTTVAGLRFSWCCFHLIKLQLWLNFRAITAHPAVGKTLKFRTFGAYILDFEHFKTSLANIVFWGKTMHIFPVFQKRGRTMNIKVVGVFGHPRLFQRF